MKTSDRISEFTIYRLSIYKRCLEHLERENIKTISSKDFAVRFGLNSAQVRKDLAYFGEFGIRGMGYPVITLKEQILSILGLTESASGKKTWKAVLIGTGQVGSAILEHHDFLNSGFEITTVFSTHPHTPENEDDDVDESHQASQPLIVPLHDLETTLLQQHVDIAILAVAEEQAQEVTNRLVNAGIHAILNFVPVQLHVPSQVKVRTVDLMAELQSLTYHLTRLDICEQQDKHQAVGR